MRTKGEDKAERERVGEVSEREKLRFGVEGGDFGWLSMKEVGDGLHEQMNCMMGALEQHGGRAGARPGDTQGHCPPPLACPVPQPASLCQPAASPESHQPRDSPCSSQSLCREGVCPPKGPCWVPRALEPSQGTAGAWPPCQECPGCDDGHDWTSSLMSQSRNRQPLVLGDNIFADLVGNWLDLPELDKKGEKGEASLSVSRSQELCRKFSLTANIFKKFLRSVRPDRDRLLKEKPCWLPPEDKQPQISKRSKKINKLKGTFYLPLHGNLQNHHSKAERCPRAESRGEHPKTGTRKVPDPRDYSQAGFDINTAVWV
ncbi:LOW QUALITY PROTEIN: PAK4-inhibitor INKA2 [Geospiza fortis]|uniref:PAK4-inhibitor INKA2 n=1 Tax=Geospiza fortis TaxID=48883 RepID=A0A8N5HX69_GEOFO|nr:LOW QUALITY PROTEIN: PAK4-inhibitor INKA2 [Geospiza fortis]